MTSVSVFLYSFICMPLCMPHQGFAGSGDLQHAGGPPRPHAHSALHESLLQDGDEVVEELVDEGVGSLESRVLTIPRAIACFAPPAAVAAAAGLACSRRPRVMCCFRAPRFSFKQCQPPDGSVSVRAADSAAGSLEDGESTPLEEGDYGAETWAEYQREGKKCDAIAIPHSFRLGCAVDCFC